MARYNGEVIQNNKVVGYFLYCSTSGYAWTYIYSTLKSMEEMRNIYRPSICDCFREPEDAILYTEYADGYYWDAKVCLYCSAIVSGADPYTVTKEWDGGFGMIETMTGPTKGYPIK